MQEEKQSGLPPQVPKPQSWGGEAPLGGFAFPTPTVAIPQGDGVRRGFPGMSLRDYFAAHVDPIPENISIDFMEAVAGPRPENADDHVAWLEFESRFDARRRYIKADAMLAARSDN